MGLRDCESFTRRLGRRWRPLGTCHSRSRAPNVELDRGDFNRCRKLSVMSVQKIQSDEPRPVSLLLRSISLGAILGSLSAIVYTVDSTIRQPNFEPASFLTALVLLFPYLLIGGVAIGVAIGATAGAVSILVFHRRHARTWYASATLICVAIAVIGVTHPSIRWTLAPTNVLAFALASVVTVLWAKFVQFAPRATAPR